MAEDRCILDPERDCIGKATAARLEQRVIELEHWKDESKKFHSNFYDWQRQQIARDAKLDEQLNNINANITKLVTWQEGQQAVPGKRWEAVIAAIIAGVVGFVLARFGLG